VLRFRLIEEVAANTEPAVEAATAPTGWLQRTLDAAGEFFGKLFSSSTVASLVKDLLPGSDKQHAAEFQLPRDPHQVLFKSVFSNSLFDDEKFNKVRLALVFLLVSFAFLAFAYCADDGCCLRAGARRCRQTKGLQSQQQSGSDQGSNEGYLGARQAVQE
jgi:hypothetical protein